MAAINFLSKMYHTFMYAAFSRDRRVQFSADEEQLRTRDVTTAYMAVRQTLRALPATLIAQRTASVATPQRTMKIRMSSATARRRRRDTERSQRAESIMHESTQFDIDVERVESYVCDVARTLHVDVRDIRCVASEVTNLMIMQWHMGPGYREGTPAGKRYCDTLLNAFSDAHTTLVNVDSVVRMCCWKFGMRSALPDVCTYFNNLAQTDAHGVLVPAFSETCVLCDVWKYARTCSTSFSVVGIALCVSEQIPMSASACWGLLQSADFQLWLRENVEWRPQFFFDCRQYIHVAELLKAQRVMFNLTVLGLLRLLVLLFIHDVDAKYDKVVGKIKQLTADYAHWKIDVATLLASNIPLVMQTLQEIGANVDTYKNLDAPSVMKYFEEEHHSDRKTLVAGRAIKLLLMSLGYGGLFNVAFDYDPDVFQRELRTHIAAKPDGSSFFWLCVVMSLWTYMHKEARDENARATTVSRNAAQ